MNQLFGLQHRSGTVVYYKIVTNKNKKGKRA